MAFSQGINEIALEAQTITDQQNAEREMYPGIRRCISTTWIRVGKANLELEMAYFCKDELVRRRIGDSCELHQQKLKAITNSNHFPSITPELHVISTSV